jgi:hypothetical protein
MQHPAEPIVYIKLSLNVNKSALNWTQLKIPVAQKLPQQAFAFEAINHVYNLYLQTRLVNQVRP